MSWGKASISLGTSLAFPFSWGLLRLFLPVCFLPIFAGTVLCLFFFSFIFSLFSSFFILPFFAFIPANFFSSYIEPTLKVEYCKLWLIEGEGSLGSKKWKRCYFEGETQEDNPTIHDKWRIANPYPLYIYYIYCFMIFRCLLGLVRRARLAWTSTSALHPRQDIGVIYCMYAADCASLYVGICLLHVTLPCRDMARSLDLCPPIIQTASTSPTRGRMVSSSHASQIPLTQPQFGASHLSDTRQVDPCVQPLPFPTQFVTLSSFPL